MFTWALLEGLRGAAADQNGRVTGRSLADWVRNAQSADSAAAGKIFMLVVVPAELSTEIFVIDQRLSLVDRDAGRLSTSLPFGLFKLKTRLGRGISQRIMLLDRDAMSLNPDDVTRLPSSVVPLSGTTSALAAHTLARAQELNASSRQAAVGGADAALMLMVRACSAPDTRLLHGEPWKGVSMVDANGATVFDAECDTRLHRGDADPYAVGSRKLAPGSYFLRQKLDDGSVLEQSLLICKGWRLEVYLLRHGAPGKDLLSVRPRVSLVMREMALGAATDDAEDRMAESVRLALAAHEGRIAIPSAMWSRMQAPASLPPFMAWSIDETVKLAARETLRKALLEPAVPDMAMETAMTISRVPANSLAQRCISLTFRLRARGDQGAGLATRLELVNYARFSAKPVSGHRHPWMPQQPTRGGACHEVASDKMEK